MDFKSDQISDNKTEINTRGCVYLCKDNNEMQILSNEKGNCSVSIDDANLVGEEGGGCIFLCCTRP